tara:strand:+ start:12 stop:332 length:321 start_codon:yes stop_codon:yes gene_type:complete
MLNKKNLLIISAIFFGILANTSLKNTNGFTKINNVILSCIFFLIVMYSLSKLMKIDDMGPIYAIYAASVTLVLYIYGLIFHKEIPSKNSIIGATFILIGVFLVNNK